MHLLRLFAGLTTGERTRRLHARTLVVARLLGNTRTTPGPLGSVGGFPAALLRAMATNAEVRLYVLEQLPEELRPLLNERAFSSDVVELVFAVLHSKLGSNFDEPTLRGNLATAAFVASLAAKPEAVRGFAMAASSKSYACHSEEAGTAARNDSSALPGRAREGRHQAMLAARGMRKAGSSAAGGGQRQKFHAHMS